MAKVDESPCSRIRFSDFELDLRAGELRKAGIRVPLQQQPFRVLSRLVERPMDVVTRDELRLELWPSDTFVDFEHGLNVAIARVREALGDNAEQPRFVETLPKRGYRFIVPVERESGPALTSSRWGLAASIVGGVAAVVLAAAALFVLRPTPALTDRDSILVADFVNKTGEELFNETLREALIVHLQQSPFFSVVSRDRVRSVLRQMTRPESEPVTGGVARELCQRAGAQVSIDGRIARIGSRYVVGIESSRCDSGDTLTSEQSEAADRENVLDALGATAVRLRARLGESRELLRRFDKPLREATTGSLEALKAFTAAEELFDTRGEFQAEPLYKRAIELDPGFGMAHARLAEIYGLTFRNADRRQALDRAIALRDRLTAREQFFVDVRACGVVTPGPRCFESVPLLWIRTYPRDAQPYQTLCAVYNRTGDYEKAVSYGQQSVRLNPDHYAAYLNLFEAYMALNRFDEATRLIETAFARGMDAIALHGYRFMVAFLARDRARMSREAQEINAHPDLFTEIGLVEANAAAAEGRMREMERLIASAEQLGSDDWKAGVRSTRAVLEASLGVRPIAIAHDIPTGTITRDWVLAALFSGDFANAHRLLEAARYRTVPPENRPIFYDRARVFVSVGTGNRSAIDDLPPGDWRELRLRAGHSVVYLRGLAYMLAGRAPAAATEFQRIIEHRGVDALSVWYPLAFVQRARAYTSSGDASSARKDYETFFQLWKDADSDVPILLAARSEYAALEASRP